MKINAQLDMDVVALEAEGTVTCLLTLEAPLLASTAGRPPEALIVVLDRSGSMAGSKLDAANASLHALVDALLPKDSFGLVTFDSQARIAIPTRAMSDHHRPTLHELIDQIEPGNTTDLSAGYLLGLREARWHRTNTGASVMVLSDGYANQGTTDEATLAQLATGARDSNITTVTIGLGEGYDDSLLEAMAAAGSGSHRFASTPDDATAIVAQEAGDLLTKAVINTFVRIRPVEPLGVDGIGTLHNVPRWIDKDDTGAPTVVIPLGDIYSGEQRELLIQFTVPSLAHLGSYELAELTVDFVALPNLEAGEVHWPVTVGVVTQHEADRQVPEPTVRVAALLAEVVATKGKAMDALQREDAKEAERQLRQGAKKLEHQASGMTNVPEPIRQRLREEETQLRALQVRAREQGLEYSRRRLREDVSLNSRGRSDDVRRTRSRHREMGE